MARIPRAQQMGLDPSAAQNTRGVVDIPVPDFSGQKAAAQALGEVGKTMLEFGNRLQEAETDRKIVTATNNTRSELDKARRAVLEDPNVKPEEYETHYQKLSDEIIKRNGAPIAGSGARAQAIWAQHTGDWQLSGTIQMRDATRRKQIETATAEVIATNASTLKQVGDLSLSAETVAENLAAQKDLNERQVMAGTLGKDDAVRLNLELDQGLQKDKLFRARDSVERLTMAGDDTGAEMMIAEFAGSAEEQKALKQAREATQQDMRAEKSRLEAEQRKAELKVANAFEMDVLQGNVGFKDLQAAVDKGEISINDQPALYRSIRAEQDRKKAEAAQSKMSAEMKAFITDRSADYKLVLDAFSMSAPAQFIGGYDNWSPQLKSFYDQMTPDDQRAVDRKQIEMGAAGQTASEAKTVYGALVDEAKRVVPDWRIGSDAKDAPKDGVAFAGKLYQVAEEISKQNGGKPLTIPQVRDAVARALDAYDPGKFGQMPTNLGDDINARVQAGVSPDYDYAAEELIFDEFRKANGRAPTPAEVQAAYKAVKGGK